MAKFLSKFLSMSKSSLKIIIISFEILIPDEVKFMGMEFSWMLELVGVGVGGVVVIAVDSVVKGVDSGRFNEAKIVSKLEEDARQNLACLFNPPADTQKWEHSSHWNVDSFSASTVTGFGPSYEAALMAVVVGGVIGVIGVVGVPIAAPW